MAPEPRKFGDYNLLERVDVGDVTETWRARCELVGAAPSMRLVSRVLPHLGGNSAVVGAFRTQAKLAAALRHPNLEQIYEVGSAREGSATPQDYVAHQLIAGRTLRVWCAKARQMRRWPMPPALAATVVFDVLAALQKVHGRSDGHGADACNAHGELNLDNVMVGFDGSVTLINLGRGLPARLAQQGLHSIAETFAYRAPEQIGGVRLAPRADLFAAGIVLAELAVGSRPANRDLLLANFSDAGAGSPLVLGIDLPLVRCPRCQWHPQATYRWTCSSGCGARTSDFYTLGWCPSCATRHTATECTICRQSSDHLDWYGSPQEIAGMLDARTSPDEQRLGQLSAALRATAMPPNGFAEVLNQALAPEPAARFSSAQHFQYALDQALDKHDQRRSNTRLAEWLDALMVAGPGDDTLSVDDDDHPTVRGQSASLETIRNRPALSDVPVGGQPTALMLGATIEPSWAPEKTLLQPPTLPPEAPTQVPLAPGGTTFVRVGAAMKHPAQHPQDITDPGGRTPLGSQLAEVRTDTNSKPAAAVEHRTDPNDSGHGTLGRYRLLARLGRGGMAETWKAQQIGAAGVTRPVVIKRILPQLASNPQFVNSFINEAKVSSNLSHGNVAAIYDFGEASGEYYLAMEFVHGRTLESVLERAQKKGFHHVPPPVACFICIELLKGLHYAHTRLGDDGQPLGIVHRDVSPDNVIVGFDGQTKVLDFGIAKARLKGRIETEPGLVKGKWNQFSPEQAAGEQLDARSDVFAAGIVLYRMVCGQQPFPGAVQRALRNIVDGKYPPPAAVNPTLSAELCSIVARALENPLPQRYQSALEMETALRQHLMKIAPEFSGDVLRAFVLWLFEDALEAEGVGARASKAEGAKFERWAGESRLALESAAAAARTRSMLNAVTRKDRRVPPRVYFGGLGFLAAVGVFATLMLVAQPKADREPVPEVVAMTPEPDSMPLAAPAEPVQDPPDPAPAPAPVPVPAAPRALSGRIKDTGGNLRITNDDRISFNECKLWVPPDRFYAWPASFALKPGASSLVPKGALSRAEQRPAGTGTLTVLECKQGTLRVRP